MTPDITRRLPTRPATVQAGRLDGGKDIAVEDSSGSEFGLPPGLLSGACPFRTQLLVSQDASDEDTQSPRKL